VAHSAMVCGSCHANVSRFSHELQGYTFGLRPDLIQDSGGFCQIVSVKEKTTHVVCFRAACPFRGPFSLSGSRSEGLCGEIISMLLPRFASSAGTRGDRRDNWFPLRTFPFLVHVPRSCVPNWNATHVSAVAKVNRRIRSISFPLESK